MDRASKRAILFGGIITFTMIGVFLLFYIPYRSGNSYGITIQDMYIAEFATALLLVTAVQAYFTYQRFRLDEEQKEPYLIAYLKSGRTLVIENTGGGNGWDCMIILKNQKNGVKERSYHTPVIYPKERNNIILSSEWLETPEFITLITYRKQEKEGELVTWSHHFDAVFGKPVDNVKPN